MDTFVIVLIVGIVLRSLLDLTTLRGSNIVVDILYATLFATLGGIGLYKDYTDIFGYVSITIAAGWLVRGYFRYRKSQHGRLQPKGTDHD